MIIDYVTTTMAYPFTTKTKAIKLRRSGYSLKEISEKLSISKSTASEWLSSIELTRSAQEKLARKQILGQYKTVLLKRKSREEQKILAEIAANDSLRGITFSKTLYKLLCTLLWWCEGNKDVTMVRFTSSDATLIKNFLFTFREGFSIDESKFRALVHLHTYHDDTIQKDYWSNETNIPVEQFHKSFQKPHTGVRTQENYQGCVAISYYDAKIAKELEAIYNAFSKDRGIR